MQFFNSHHIVSPNEDFNFIEDFDMFILEN